MTNQDRAEKFLLEASGSESWWIDGSNEFVRRRLVALLDEAATDDEARLEALAKRPPSVEVPRRNAIPAEISALPELGWDGKPKI